MRDVEKQVPGDRNVLLPRVNIHTVDRAEPSECELLSNGAT